MAEGWVIYSQPVEYIQAVRAKFQAASRHDALQALDRLRNSEDIRFNNGDPAQLKLVFSAGSSIHIPEHRLKRKIPVDISISIPFDENVTDADKINRMWGNTLPDLQAIVSLGGRFTEAPSWYFRGAFMDPEELPEKDRRRYYEGDLSKLNLTGLEFIPTATHFSLIWGDRYYSVLQKRLHSSSVGRWETKPRYKVFGRSFGKSREFVPPQNLAEWEQGVKEEYERVKTEYP